MTATNHAVTGAVITASIANPFIGLPLALISHFFLDAIPHFGAHTVASVKSKEFKYILITDGILLMSFLLIAGYAGYKAGFDWWLIPLGGFLGASPDVMWINHYKADLNGSEKQWGFIRKFHKVIQQWEFSWGWVVESIWFITFVFLLKVVLFT